MPVEYKVPGVYIEELPPGSRPIQGVGTAMPAFIGFTESRPRGNTGQPVFVASWTQYTEEFGGFAEDFYLPYAVYGYFLNGGQSCYVQSLATAGDADRVRASLTSLAQLPSQAGLKTLELRSKPGVTRGLSVVIEDAGPEAVPSPTGDEARPAGEAPALESAPPPGPAAGGGGVPAAPERFKLSIYEGDNRTPTESYSDLVVGKGGRGARNVVDALQSSRLVSAVELSAEGTALERRPRNGQYELDEQFYGAQLATVDTFKGNVSERTGLGALEAIPEITLLVCPDLMSAYMRSEQRDDDLLILAGMQNELLNHCAKMKDRFAILDAPPGMQVKEIQDYRNKTLNPAEDAGKYGALYYPWICIANPNARNGGNRLLMVPPSGHIAGIYARVDETRGVHKAPANEGVRGALQLERRLIDSEQAELNPIGINCIRWFPGRGILVWGARTLAPASSEWRYINVRRLFNFIEESIYEGTQWVVFEPNNVDLWERVKRTITIFLTRVWQSGALLGATPQEAFYVKCDAELNPPAVRDAGQLIVEVGLAPVKPAEFVIFRFKQMSDGGSVSE
ncbi:MAG: phage tail sheath family protein [Chloroflexi bacterium]|nr:phage tail sheath family protein [Chloroflexota bacterium]